MEDTITKKEFTGIDGVDYAVIVAYFVAVLATGLYSSWKSKRDSVGGYFLASRSMHFIPVGASLFASNIGSGHFIGLAGTAASSGIGVNVFELGAIYFIMLLGWFFIPVYLASGVYTMPEYLQRRFGGQRIRIYLSMLALLLYVFTKISADLYAGALFITKATNSEGQGAIYVAILILLAIACLFTIAGGLTAVIWTDFVQTILMIAGAFVLAGISFYEVGGYENLMDNFFNATASKRLPKNPNNLSEGYCGDIPKDSMHLFRSSIPGESDLPWTGVVFGLSISSIWYWCSDQVIVQRVLAAKDFSHAKGGCILAGYLKFLPLWIMIFPGMAARVLYKDEVGCSLPEECSRICDSERGCTNIAFIKLVTNLLPQGLRGLMLAVMLAALMSSLTSIFNSASTIFTMDIYTRIRKSASETELLVAGRLFVLVLVVISIIWIPVINASKDSQLFVYIQSITSFLAPPICAVYLLAIFWPRTNEAGAFWGLIVGLVIGLARFVLEFSYSKPLCGDVLSPRPPNWWYLLIDDFHFLNFGVLLWGITGIVTIIVSLFTPAIPEDELYRLTYWSRNSILVRKNRNFNEPNPQKEKETLSKSAITSSDEDISACKRMFNRIIKTSGNKDAQQIEDPAEKLTEEEEAIRDSEAIMEDDFWRRVCEFNVVLILAIACFAVGFYA